MKDFAMLGAAGYIAPRHMKAIKDTGNNLVAALDPFDSIGIIDSYFPRADFFTEFERFERHIDKLRRKGKQVDFVSICSPNFLHDSHIRFGLRNQASVICEKPLVLNPWNVDALAEIEGEYPGNIYNILQLRLHPSIQALKKKVQENPGHEYDIDLTYLTSRGNWYFRSWKGETEKSGGIASNIGVHFYDMLLWIFGGLEEQYVHAHESDYAAGFLKLANAKVRWFLSVNEDYLPKDVQEKGQRTFRSITVDGEEIEFSGGFTDLHTRCYEDILSGGGFGVMEARPSIDLVQKIRTSQISDKGEKHSLLSGF